MLKTKLKPIAAALLATGLFVGYALPAYSTPAIRQQVTLEPGRSITPQEEAAMSSAAVKVLRHIAQARADIDKKDAPAAKTNLEKADTLVNIIETSLPTTTVKDRIWVAKKHLEYEDSQEVLPDLVPIYASLDEIADFVPVKQAREHIDKAKAHMKAGKNTPATKELEAADAALVYTEVDLPIAATRHFIASAKAALAKNKFEDADKALKAAEDNVVFLSVDMEEPLVPAKSALWHAVRHYAEKQYGAAKNDIKQATTYLEQAAKSGDETLSKEAQSLLKRAKGLESEVEKGGEKTAAEIDHLWRRTEALTERTTEYVSTGWSRLRADEPARPEIIEAKLHLAFAQIEQATDRDSDQATRELKQAAKYLEQAAQKVTKSANHEDATVKELTRLRSQTEALAKQKASKRTPEQYTQIKEQMRRLIQIL